MRAELISVGTEILLGQILNTNAQYLSQECARLGVNVYRQVTVGDNPDRLRDVLTESLRRSDLVVTTGGLGPTQDDITKQTAAEALGLSMELDEAVWEDIKKIYREYGVEVTSNARSQAMIPRGARVLPNRRGTAPGVIASRSKGEPSGTIICLPGPTTELTGIWESEVRSWIKEQTEAGEMIISRVLKVCGMGESSVEDEIGDLLRDQDDPTVAPYAKTGEVHIRLTTRAGSEDAARTKIDPVEQTIRDSLNPHVYGSDEDTLAGVILKELRRRDWTLATAELSTGGGIADQLTQGEPDRAYRGGWIGSENGFAETEPIPVLESDELDVRRATSESEALSLASRLRDRFDVDVLLLVSGQRESTGDNEDPAERMFTAISGPGGNAHHRIMLRGDRPTRKERAAGISLGQLYLALHRGTLTLR